jgi:hypothetical protein
MDPRLAQNRQAPAQAAPQRPQAPQGAAPQGQNPMQQAQMEIAQMPRPDLEQLALQLVMELQKRSGGGQAPQGGGMA